MHLTDEQSSIINYRGQKLVVEARAGSGKTFTLVKYAEANPQERMLYLAYNRAIRDEGASKFPRNVVCKTSHQLAFAAIGRNFRHKLTNNLRLTDIAKAANTNNWQLARDVQDTLNTFMCSADTSVEPQHFVRIQRTETTKQEKYKAMVLDIAKRLWNRMIDPTAEFSITHDGYLKLYQLKKPDLSRQYSTILFDEAQDANEVTSDIVMSQKAKVIMVGDSHQQIYRYRGAEDALQRSEMQDADRLFLTNSFRFGSRIALVSNLLLALKGEKRPTMGMADQDKIVTEIPEGLPHVALLHRTVMGTIESALEAAGRGKKVYWVGGIDSYQIGELEDLFWFSRNQKDRVRSKKLLDEYNDYETYEHIAKESDDVEMKRAVVMLGRYENLPAKLQQLKVATVKDEMEAHVTVSTAHRSKGLEWDYVSLQDDFKSLLDPELEEGVRNDEINLLYVASTRAMKVLRLNSAVIEACKLAKKSIIERIEPHQALRVAIRKKAIEKQVA